MNKQFVGVLAICSMAIVLCSGCAYKKRVFGASETRASFQVFEERQGTPCGELVSSTRKLVRDYFALEQFDSARLALQYYTDQCGVNDFSYRVNLALTILTGEFSEQTYNRSVIEYIINYRNSIPSYRRGGGWGDFASPVYYRRPISEDMNLDDFARRIAFAALEKTMDGSVEQLLCECLSGDCDSLFLKLRTPRYAGTRLRAFYDASILEVLRDRDEGHFALYSGYFSPNGKNEVLGGHPVFGAKMGGKGGHFALDVVSEVRLLDAPKAYVVDHDSKIDTTKQYLGYYLGLELGRELFHSPIHEMLARIGAGFDGFGYGSTSAEGPRPKVHSFNFNVGLQYKWFLGKCRLPYVGVEGLFNTLNYERNGGDQLRGNAFEVRVLFGWSGNTYDNRRLRELDY
jgi:hypothetical protein